MLRKALILSSIIFFLTILAIAVFIATGPSLPAGTDAVIEGVLRSELPELVTGKTGMAKSGEINIWYESICITERPKDTVLLIMGASSSALAWSNDFIDPLVRSGYRVVRYDNRDTGMSDRVEIPYSLEDMARDAVAVLDAVEVPRAHIIGISMGGMIAQRLAISHGDRVLSMTSIASSADFNDMEIPKIYKKLMPDQFKLILRYGLIPSEKNTVKLVVGFMQLFRGDGDYPTDIKGIAEFALYEMRKRKGFNMEAQGRHTSAINVSGSRYKELGKIKVPVLILHGKADPVLSFKHSEKMAALIPGAELLLIDGMGHDLPRPYLPKIHGAILANFGRVH